MKTFQWILSLSLLALVAACGVDSVQATRDNVQPLELRTFPKTDWRLANNKFFLWREDMTPAQVSRAVAIGKEIDNLDGQALPLNRRHSELDALISPLKDTVKSLKGHLNPVKALFDRTTRKKTDTETALAAAQGQLKLEKDKPQPSAEQIALLASQISSLQATLSTVQEQLTGLKPVKERLEREVAEQNRLLEPLQTEMDELEARQLQIEEAGRKQVDEIMTVVDWYKDQPTAVNFQFRRDGQIGASIAGWNLGDDAGPRNLSTDAIPGKKPTMANVKYTELGGVFEFDAYIYTDEEQQNLRETYHFRVGRIKYDYPDGRQFFGGDITRTSADGTIRRGQAKLVDRNN